jgi:lipoprotein-anchoring transpeptidase ErfK/SrfK
MHRLWPLVALLPLSACIEPAPPSLLPVAEPPAVKPAAGPAAKETPLRYVLTPGPSNIRVETSAKAKLLGQTMSSARLPVYEEVPAAEDSGCKSTWLRVQYGGWLCADSAKETSPGEEVESHFENRFPDQGAVVQKETDVYALPGGKVTGKKPKDARVAVSRITTFDGKDYAQIGAASFVDAADLKYNGRGSFNSAMKGAVFDDQAVFPFVFFVADDTPLYDAPGVSDKKRAVGHKVRFGRAPVLAEQKIDEKTYLRIEGGWFLKEKGHIVVSPEPRPVGIAADARWTLVDLSRQLITAYEGDKLVFATLTSSGRASHRGAFWTVTGSFRIERKYRVKDMEGNPFGDHYLVKDVPWPQYFFEGYAFHGAFWHNNFGRIASHGCLNLTGADAKWMSDFLYPQIPPGWQTIFPPLSMDTSIVIVRN